MAGRLLAIALNTFREKRRDRVLYVLLLFGGLMIVTGLAVSELAPFEQEKILLDVGQAAMFLMGSLIALLLGIGLVSTEIERRTIYVIISKPVGRAEFLIGKVVGLSLTLSAAVAMMSVVLVGIVILHGGKPTLALIQAQVLLWFELVLLVCMSVAFASFVSSTTLAAMLSFSVWVLGQVSADLADLAKRSQAVGRVIFWVLYWVLPNLSLFDKKARASYGVPIPAAEFFTAIAYGIAYSVMLLALASALFSRRDFK